MILAAIFVLWGAYHEFENSTLQSLYFSRLGRELKFKVMPGPSGTIRFPRSGPYDKRLGYTRLPQIIERLRARGFDIEAQARISRRMQELADEGIFLPYSEKSQAGLTILDRDNRPLFSARYPERVYRSFDAIPAPIVQALLFIENRELLDPDYPRRNPAVDWTRLTQAVADKLIQIVVPEHHVPGASTLITQIEKFRHSPDGLTSTVEEKLRQMVSASVRAYFSGPNTLAARKQVVVDYLNTVPLSAAPGMGEINGLGDGLWAWYGLDFNTVNRRLASKSDPEPDRVDDTEALAFKSVLSLLVAQRTPSYYLNADHAALEALTNSYLRLLADAGVIDRALRDAALKTRLPFAGAHQLNDKPSFVSEKAANAVRTRLSALLDLPRLYDLDRLDLSVRSTLDAATQKAVTAELKRLSDPSYLRAAALMGPRLLGSGDPSRVIYSFTLYELRAEGALLRVQADNLEEPFDINEGTKLDLGSTAKLRTLITYLDVIAQLHDRYAGLPPDRIKEERPNRGDNLTRWAIEYLLGAKDKSLGAMLEAAMQRRYSANPHETFFTGGGIHNFDNFQHEDDAMTPTVSEALAHSINLAFIRLMRDVVHYYMFRVPGSSARLLEDASDPQRKVFLRRFADRESRTFLYRFYRKYKGMDGDRAMEQLLEGIRPNPKRLAAIYRYLEPDASFEDFSTFVDSRLPNQHSAAPGMLRRLYDAHAPGRYSLADRGFIAQVHPLELWVVGYLRRHPTAVYDELVRASADERIAVYDWLMKTNRKNAQDQRLSSLLEVEAFLEIHREWQQLGYPFPSLVPSLATAIGSSADRPAALAELMGIIVNGGVQPQTMRIEALQFAAGTPYETCLRQKPAAGKRVLRPEIAATVREALLGVVENGTAKRLNQAFRDSHGNAIAVGGKTGTGDHRYKTFLPGGRLVESRVVDRAATFVFYIGDRFFGTVTAYVPGPQAANYRFTSALPVQLLKQLISALTPLTGAAH